MTRATPLAVRTLLAALLLGLLAGCGAVATRTAPPPEAVAQNPLIAEASQLARDAATQGGSGRAQSEARIDRLLSQLDDEALAREAAALPEGDPLYSYAGRALLRRGLPLPRPFDRGQWQFDAGSRPPADSDGYRPPTRLAVLLPLSGDLATAASPVRDGLLAGYYGERRRRPEINFIDTHGTAGGALSAYDRAVADGHDFVVGPLGRDEVDALFGRGTLQVPVLALNRGTVAPPPGNASFALSPEDEGMAAAEYLIDRGALRVLAVGGESDTQQRAIASLRERLAERGGVVTDVVGARTEDFSVFAQKDGGVDAVFLAVRGEDARGVVPKLAMAGLAGKPRVATSQLLSGTGKPDDDRVLDGIAFPTLAWNSRSIRGLPGVESAAATLPTAKGGGARLFAFGFDAWLLTAYLEHLALSADGRVDGATGTLRIDGFGQVQRTPAWSTFIGGRQVPLAGAER